MLGELLLKIRKDKHITRAALARDVNVDAGHITHIEKNERTPSHKALKRICSFLDVPYQQLMYSYDKEILPIHESYDFINHIDYNSVIAIDNLETLIHCPAKFGSAAIAIKINDDSMEPTLLKGSYAFVEFNSPLDSRDIGLFFYNDKFIIRRFIITRSSNIQLVADKSNCPKINLSKSDNFYIIGKILGTNDDY